LTAVAAAGRRAWLALAGVLIGGSLPGWFLPAAGLDWQPALAAAEPWRAWTAVFVHWSPLHLGANLLAAAVVAWFGLAARLPWPAALAWGVAWPLTHVGLLLRPELVHYGGLSGVLHAGVAVAVLWLAVTGRGRARAVGAAVLAGLGVKLLIEAPWGPALRHGGGWDIATAPIAHTTGALAGLVCGAVALWLGRQPTPPAAAPARPPQR
jgi:rhomboid family GlyGly-CTERM serine protease